LSKSSFDQNNPYQAPLSGEPTINFVPATAASLHLFKTLKQFRSQIAALGALWIFIGIAWLILGALANTWGAYEKPEAVYVIAAFLITIALTWIVLGVLACMKQLPAVYIALALSYLLLVASLAELQVCLIVLLIIAILQAHRVLGWAKELRRAGIPLTTKPQDLQVKISVPA
jgi:hypothetical protein